MRNWRMAHIEAIALVCTCTGGLELHMHWWPRATHALVALGCTCAGGLGLHMHGWPRAGHARVASGCKCTGGLGLDMHWCCTTSLHRWLCIITKTEAVPVNAEICVASHGSIAVQQREAGMCDHCCSVRSLSVTNQFYN